MLYTERYQISSGKNDSNTLRVDANVFIKREKKLRFQNYPDTCARDNPVKMPIFSQCRRALGKHQ